MGYNTEFKGQLTFTTPATPEQLARLQTFFGEDCRDHPEWEAPNFYYVDLKLTSDESGIEWDGAEKTYYLEGIVDMILQQMRKTWPDFDMVGTLIAQGDDLDDRWALTVSEGHAHKMPIVVSGKVVVCPHCAKSIVLEGV